MKSQLERLSLAKTRRGAPRAECAFRTFRAARAVTEINFRKHYWHGRQVLLRSFRQSRVISGRNRLETGRSLDLRLYKRELRSGMQLLQLVSRDIIRRVARIALLAHNARVSIVDFHFVRLTIYSQKRKLSIYYQKNINFIFFYV